MGPDHIIDMVNFEFVNQPHTFTDGKGTWVVRFQAVEGGHCVQKPPNETWKVTGDLTITPEGFEPAISAPNFQDLTITGTQGTWSFQCCVHGPDMAGEISVEPPKSKY